MICTNFDSLGAASLRKLILSCGQRNTLHICIYIICHANETRGFAPLIAARRQSTCTKTFHTQANVRRIKCLCNTIKNMATSRQKKSQRAGGVRRHSIAANLHTALWSGAGHEPLGEMHLTPASRALMGAAKQI